MSYMALYRKWRPDDFKEVKGQEHIVTTLRNQVKHERIGHAYLFCGTRGTGKTTMAKLMAKAVNCEHPLDGSPCNECESCRSIAAGTSMNVIEIDAASNNGVDNIREINNAVQYSPQTGKKLVYIIDEVHMLSNVAFNAMLKTLEEPPSYVLFILATTEPHKIPITIHSRCQRFDFRRITIETIADRLMDLLDRENISATREAVNYVAKAADGSMRDALSILEQCISFNLGEELTYDRVLETIGAVDIEVYIDLFQAVISNDVEAAVNIVDQAVWQGKDLTQFTNEFTGFVRNVLMLKLNPDMSVDVTTENISRLVELGKDLSEGYLINYINILQEAAGKISYATTKRIVLEVTIIKLCKPSMQQDYSALEKRLEELETKLEKGTGAAQVVYVNNGEIPDNATIINNSGAVAESEADAEAEGKKVVENIKQHYGEATAKEILILVDLWNQYKASTMKVTREYLNKVKAVPGDAPSSIDLVIVKSNSNRMTMEYFEKSSNIEHIEEDLSEFAGRDIHIGIRKLTEQEAKSPTVVNFDLSKIKYKIDYKY